MLSNTNLYQFLRSCNFCLLSGCIFLEVRICSIFFIISYFVYNSNIFLIYFISFKKELDLVYTYNHVPNLILIFSDSISFFSKYSLNSIDKDTANSTLSFESTYV